MSKRSGLRLSLAYLGNVSAGQTCCQNLVRTYFLDRECGRWSSTARWRPQGFLKLSEVQIRRPPFCIPCQPGLGIALSSRSTLKKSSSFGPQASFRHCSSSPEVVRPNQDFHEEPLGWEEDEAWLHLQLTTEIRPNLRGRVWQLRAPLPNQLGECQLGPHSIHGCSMGRDL